MFDQVTDPRDRRGRRWRLSALLSGALVSMVLLARSLSRAEQITEDLAGSRLLRRLGIGVEGASQPVLLPATANRRWLGALPVSSAQRHAHQLTRCGGHPPGADTRVNQRGGHFGDFFNNLRKAYSRANLLEVVTSDAGVLSEAHCRMLDDLGLGYVVALKGNNPSLEVEARRLVESLAETEPPAAADAGWECDSSRGWIKRELWTCAEIAGWPGWEHLRQVWLLRVLCRDGSDGPVRVLEDRLFCVR